MKNKKLKLSTLLFLGLGITGLQAQEIIPATGGNALGSGGIVSYSVGQVAYTSKTNTNFSVSEGVQQAYKISVVTELEKAKGINLTISAYPNPTTDYLMLDIKNLEIKALRFHLYDVQGNLLQNKKITSEQTHVIMNNLMSATYIVKVIKNDNEIKAFKIIKN